MPPAIVPDVTGEVLRKMSVSLVEQGNELQVEASATWPFAFCIAVLP
jgi:hypothetical protein